VSTFDIHLDVKVHDADDFEYTITEVEIGAESIYVIIEPDPAVYTQIRMDEGPRPEHVDVYKAALIEHDGDVTEALRALYIYLMRPSAESADS
jgi:hypothetical protein